mgnify:FL=1
MKRTTLDKAEKPLSGRSFHIQIIFWKSTRNLINRAFQGDNQEKYQRLSSGNSRENIREKTGAEKGRENTRFCPLEDKGNCPLIKGLFSYLEIFLRKRQ